MGHPVQASPVARREPIRVLHLLPDLAAGGGQRLVLDIFKNLDPSRIAITLAHIGTDTTLEPEFLAAGFEPVQLAHGSRRAALSATVAGLRLLAQRRIDIINTHGDREKRLGELLATLGRRPYVQHVHGVAAEGGRSATPATVPIPVPAHRRALSRILDRHFVAVSQTVYDQRRPYLLAAGDSVHLVQNGVDVDRFAAGTAEQERQALLDELELAGDQPVLVSVARLVAGKGMESLIPLMSHLRRDHPNAVLLVVGDGPERARLEQLFQDAGITAAVRFLGTRSDVPRLLALATVFVFPTTREGFGLVAVEAMAAGLPLVASDLPPLRAIVDDGRTGLLVPVGDGDSLFMAVHQILTDRDLAAGLGAAARQAAQARFRIQATADALSDVYELILRRG